ncbi:MAG: LPP20 family lipoprotein [Pseudomonadota bacterium]
MPLSAINSHSSRLFSLLLMAFAALALSACGGRTTIESDLGIDGAPDWVNEGTQAVEDDDGRLIQGVGMAPAMGDFSLQRSTADNRARAEIARVLSSYIDATIEDFSAHSGGQTDVDIEQTLKSETRQLLSGARIVGHWKNPENGDIYAFAELDMEAVEENLKLSKSLTGAFKEYFEERGGQTFKQVVQETK